VLRPSTLNSSIGDRTLIGIPAPTPESMIFVESGVVAVEPYVWIVKYYFSSSGKLAFSTRYLGFLKPPILIL
jgi:hypothetical protein